eukprot:6205666-Amphidinium_carterae.2
MAIWDAQGSCPRHTQAALPEKFWQKGRLHHQRSTGVWRHPKMVGCLLGQGAAIHIWPLLRQAAQLPPTPPCQPIIPARTGPGSPAREPHCMDG